MNCCLHALQSSPKLTRIHENCVSLSSYQNPYCLTVCVTAAQCVSLVSASPRGIALCNHMAHYVMHASLAASGCCTWVSAQALSFQGLQISPDVTDLICAKVMQQLPREQSVSMQIVKVQSDGIVADLLKLHDAHMPAASNNLHICDRRVSRTCGQHPEKQRMRDLHNTLASCPRRCGLALLAAGLMTRSSSAGSRKDWPSVKLTSRACALCC